MPSNPAQLIGESPAFHWLMDRVSDAASIEKPVLIVGERGTGKELIASRLHFLSPRWEKTYIQVNCGAYSDTLLDSLLFGQTYYDGRSDIDGQFVRAESGTLFLDNIEFVSLRLQEKLLQALDYGTIDPLGGPDTQKINVRLIAATGIDLQRAVSENRFRADLLDHLSFDVITLPPLRARREDIPSLAEYFARRQASALGAEKFPGFTPEALIFLGEQDWAGNIRELKTVIERSIGRAFLIDESLSRPIDTIANNPFESPWPLKDRVRPHQNNPPTSSDKTLPNPLTHPPALEDQPLNNHQKQTPDSFSDRVMVFERRLIDEALNVSDNHQGKAADYLALSYHQFRGLLRKHGLKK